MKLVLHFLTAFTAVFLSCNFCFGLNSEFLDCPITKSQIINQLGSSSPRESYPNQFSSRNGFFLSCINSYDVVNDHFTDTQSLQFYRNCSAEEISKFFKPEASIVSLALLVDSLSLEKFHKIVFTRRLRESTIWNEDCLLSAVNLIGEENNCGNFLGFMMNLDFSNPEETTMALYLLQRLAVSSAVKIQQSDWPRIESFLRKIVHVLSNELRVFSLENFASKTAANLLFHAYRSKGLNTADTVYLVPEFIRTFPRFLPGTDPSIFDTIRPLDIVYMVENDVNNHMISFLQNRPDFGRKVFEVLQSAKSSRFNAPYREAYAIRLFLENPHYYSLFSAFVDPNEYPTTFDRDSSSQGLQKTRWLPVTEQSSQRSFLYKRFFVLNTLNKENMMLSTQHEFPIAQLMCVLTNKQFEKALKLTRDPLKWLEGENQLPMNCFDEIKASKIVALKSERFEMGILPTSYASKLENFDQLLPFIDWSILIGSEVSPKAAQSFLCSDGCKYCTTAQKVALLEKSLQAFRSFSNDKECELNELSPDLIALLSDDIIQSQVSEPNENLRRWQRLKISKKQDIGDIDLTISPWQLSTETIPIPKFLQKLEPILRHIKNEDLQIYSKSIVEMLENYYVPFFSVDKLSTFGVQLLPVSVLLQTTETQWPRNPSTCHEFFGKIGASEEIETEFWAKRNLLLRHYLNYCSVYGFNTPTYSDILVLDKLSCDLEPTDLRTLGARAITENLPIFGKCCLSPEQIDAIRDVIGPLKNWEPYWLSLFGETTCDIIDDDKEHFKMEQLNSFEGLALAEILTNQRYCNRRSSLISGYEFKNKIDQLTKYDNCLKNVTKMVIDKLEVKHYVALGWKDASCKFDNSEETSLKTCAALMTLEKGIKHVEIEELSKLSDCEFDACAHYFGNKVDLTSEQTVYIVNRIIEVRKYRNDWYNNKEKVMELLHLIPYTEPGLLVGVLSWADLNMVNRLLSVQNWSRNQSELIIDKYEVLIQGKWTTTHLSALLPNVICHFSLESLSPKVLREFIPVAREQISECDGTDFYRTYLKLFMNNRDHSYLSPSDVQMLGNIMAGLDPLSSIEVLTHNVHEISPRVFKSWDNFILEDVVNNVANFLTPKQIQALLLSNKLSTKYQEKLLELASLNGYQLKRIINNEKNEEKPESTNQEREMENEIIAQVTSEPVGQSFKLEIVYVFASSESLRCCFELMFMLLLKHLAYL